jgi:hypothetical protein
MQEKPRLEKCNCTKGQHFSQLLMQLIAKTAYPTVVLELGSLLRVSWSSLESYIPQNLLRLWYICWLQYGYLRNMHIAQCNMHIAQIVVQYGFRICILLI